MHIEANEFYHIYNKGNNGETIFLDEQDYLEFLSLFRKYVLPFTKVVAYCLMPNHFHCLLYTSEEAPKIIKSGSLSLSHLANGFRLLQSRYAHYFNLKYNRKNSLFKQKVQTKCLREGRNNYLQVAFRYIHQNPVQAGIVGDLLQWPYSSFLDYANIRKGTLCDKALAFQWLEINETNFVNALEKPLENTKAKQIFV